MKPERNHRSAVRPQRLMSEILDACRSYIVPSSSDPLILRLDVARVDVSDDLCNVSIHLTPVPGEEPPSAAEIREGFERALPFFRRMLAEAVPMKRAPLLRLAYDPVPPAIP